MVWIPCNTPFYRCLCLTDNLFHWFICYSTVRPIGQPILTSHLSWRRTLNEERTVDQLWTIDCMILNPYLYMNLLWMWEINWFGQYMCILHILNEFHYWFLLVACIIHWRYKIVFLLLTLKITNCRVRFNNLKFFLIILDCRNGSAHWFICSKICFIFFMNLI